MKRDQNNNVTSYSNLDEQGRKCQNAAKSACWSEMASDQTTRFSTNRLLLFPLPVALKSCSGSIFFWCRSNTWKNFSPNLTLSLNGEPFISMISLGNERNVSRQKIEVCHQKVFHIAWEASKQRAHCGTSRKPDSIFEWSPRGLPCTCVNYLPCPCLLASLTS